MLPNILPVGSTHQYSHFTSLDDDYESEYYCMNGFHNQLTNIPPIHQMNYIDGKLAVDNSSASSLLNLRSHLYGGEDDTDHHEQRFEEAVAAAVEVSTTSTAVVDDEKTKLALKNHKEAEKRRRERINSHLDRLRSMLPCNAKTDKATLLSKVVQRVRELNRETSVIMTHLQQQQQHHNNNNNDNFLTTTIPSLADGYTVDHFDDDSSSNLILKASLCCEDRSDLFSDLSQVVNGLNLKTLRAEMLSLGGRVTNVLVLSGDRGRAEEYVAFLDDALKGMVQKSGPTDRLKRRRRMEVP